MQPQRTLQDGSILHFIFVRYPGSGVLLLSVRAVLCCNIDVCLLVFLQYLCETPNFGLRQSNGGPCGVLAAVQAEIIRSLLFGEALDAAGTANKLPDPTDEEVSRLFALSVFNILSRAEDGIS